MATLAFRKISALAAGVLLLGATAPVNLHFLSALPALDVPLSLSTVVEGRVTGAVGKAYGEELVFRPAAVTLFDLVAYAVFGEARRGAIVGEDGWLFTAEEFATDPGAAARVDGALDRIAAVGRVLASDGVALAVAVIPAKARIYPEQLGSYRLPDEPATRYDRILAGLRARGVPVADIAAAFGTAPDTPALFLRTDTHWTPDGAAVAARTVAALASGLADLGPETAGSLTRTAPVRHDGDLLNYLALGPFREALGPPPDVLEPVSFVEEGGEDVFLDEPASPSVALVGTSYSADERWGFAAHLGAALRHAVVNAAEIGRGPFAPMDAYLAGEAYRTARPRLVVWEIPERFVDDADPATDPSGPQEE